MPVIITLVGNASGAQGRSPKFPLRFRGVSEMGEALGTLRCSAHRGAVYHRL